MRAVGLFGLIFNTFHFVLFLMSLVDSLLENRISFLSCIVSYRHFNIGDSVLSTGRCLYVANMDQDQDHDRDSTPGIFPTHSVLTGE